MDFICTTCQNETNGNPEEMSNTCLLCQLKELKIKLDCYYKIYLPKTYPDVSQQVMFYKNECSLLEKKLRQTSFFSDSSETSESSTENNISITRIVKPSNLRKRKRSLFCFKNTGESGENESGENEEENINDVKENEKKRSLTIALLFVFIFIFYALFQFSF